MASSVGRMRLSTEALAHPSGSPGVSPTCVTPSAYLPSPVGRPRKRASRAALKQFGCSEDGQCAETLKKKFQSLDDSGNGMLELSELAKLLPGLEEDELDVLFNQMDKDGNEHVSFDEFIDFVFRPVGEGPLLERIDSDDENLEEFKRLRSIAEVKEERKAKVDKVAFGGSSLYKAVNGEMEIADAKYNGFPVFEWSRTRRLKNTEPLERSDKCGSKPAAGADAPRFSLAIAGQNLQLFYSWTSDYSKIGWFIAELKPPAGEPVSEYILFNPSPLADTPDCCRAMWETRECDYDKRMFCADATVKVLQAAGEIPEDNLCDDELWGELSEDEEADWKQGKWDNEWELQPGEDSAGVDPDHPGGDGWDSDDYLTQNKHRVQIGEDARKAKAAEEAAAAIDSGTQEAEETPQVEATTEASGEGIAKSKPKPTRVPRDKKKGRRKAFMLDGMVHAPGFEIKKTKGQTFDHMAHRHKGKKTTQLHHIHSDGVIGSGHGAANLEGDAVDLSAASATDEDIDFSIYEDGRFIDAEFPPCPRSLGVDMSEVDGWARLSQLTADPCLFHKIIPESCFTQAFPGNVWFSSACAAAAEYPAWIQSMFGHKTRLSKAGRYKVRLYHPGQKRFVHIVVDDFVPVTRLYRCGSPAFAGISGDGEIWAALVEKAFAKFCGSYAATEWGLHAHGMHYICGGSFTGSWARLGPSRWRRSCTMWSGNCEDTLDRSHGEGRQEVGDWRDEDEVWAMLRLAMERCYPTACGIDKSKRAEVGLLDDRLYSMIGAREVPTQEGWTLRMVLLRNPYPDGKWEGRWSGSSTDDAWEKNPEAREILDYNPNSGGTFWMSYSDFDQYFEVIDTVRKSMPVQGCNTYKLGGIKRGLMKYQRDQSK